MQPPTELVEFLNREDRFLIATHMNPDGDAIGSALALALALESLGKSVAVLDQDPVPEQYRFLPESSRFCTFSSLAETGVSIESCNNLILVDCNDLSRVTPDRELAARFGFRNALVIDHHATRSSFGTVKWIDPSAAATGLLVLAVIDALGVSVSGSMATNLYAALVVDTGNFRFENTDPSVLRAAARLAEAGAHPTAICRALYESWSLARLALFGRFLNTLEMNGRVAMTVVTLQMLQETGARPEDTETFVEFLKIVNEADVTILVRELEKNYYKLSLRSKGVINVAVVAEAFGGGGHANAAGFCTRGDSAEVKARILKKLHEQQKG
ncbi:MAG: phosphoesterase RecJ domain-containing protein [Nitrospirae bacterium]|nr:MAG: phosphoesterase RecJ domain-containing protein [Nitrospirota bacterium]